MANMPCGFPLRPIYAPASPCHTHLSVYSYHQGPSGILDSLWSRCSLKTHPLSPKLLWCFSLSHVTTLPASSSFLPYWPVYCLTWCVTSVSQLAREGLADGSGIFSPPVHPQHSPAQRRYCRRHFLFRCHPSFTPVDLHFISLSTMQNFLKKFEFTLHHWKAPFI